MEVLPSTIQGTVLSSPGPGISLPPGFPADTLEFCVEVQNCAEKPIAFLGIRFDLVKKNGRPAVAMQYADTLRHPDKVILRPGRFRLVCIEHGLTDAVIRGIPLNEIPGGRRMLMNLRNVQEMPRVTASLDCIAYTDGCFAGPDSGKAFDRLAEEREREFRDQKERPLRIALVRI